MVIRADGWHRTWGYRGGPNRWLRESVTDVMALVVWKNKNDCGDWSTCGGFVVDG
jgi:hypothetical protein